MQKFEIASILRIEGVDYLVIGWIRYRNPKDHCEWIEYRMRLLNGTSEAWLSIDDDYKEYSISFMTSWVDDRGFHVVDEGTEFVSGKSGEVDVDIGEHAHFIEYEDATEEKIISVEVWSDGKEVSEGHYLDEDEIQWVGKDESYAKSIRSAKRVPVILGLIVVFIFVGMYITFLFMETDWSFLKHERMSKYLKKQESLYSLITAESGPGKLEALVYESTVYNVASTATDIIDGIEGDTQYVQKDVTDEEDGSIAILTKDEYCLIYVGEDGKVYVQVSPREYTYRTDTTPYRSTHRTGHYYRDFYYGTGYGSDSGSYSDSSPYSSYESGDFSYSGDSFSAYSSSIRQSSITARSSSSGGISAGK